MSVLIRLDDISVQFCNRWVFQNISQDIKARDFITIIGANGAGKTTLLKCCMGLCAPTRGTVWRKPGIRVGYVAQEMQTHHTMPVLAHTFLRLRKSFTAQRYEEVIAETHIDSFLQVPLHLLSGGQRQRLLLARALLEKPDILILDEPSQNLDLAAQLRFYKLLKDIYEQEQVSIIMVSHDLHMVMALTQQVICLLGDSSCSGRPQVIAQNPEFEKFFGKTMSELVAVYKHHHDNSKV